MTMTTIHVRPGEGRHYPMIDGDHIAKAAVQDACGAFELFEVIAPAAPMAPPHISPWTGVLFLLEGRITAQVDGTTYDVDPGRGGRLPGRDPGHLRSRRRVRPVRGGHLRRRRGKVLRRLRELRAGGPAGRGRDGGHRVGDQATQRCPGSQRLPVRARSRAIAEADFTLRSCSAMTDTTTTDTRGALR
jgi:hypothetical protein